MALVTIRRSPSVQTPRKTDEAEKRENIEDDVGDRVSKSLNECYFANKGAAVVLGGSERGCQWRSPARALPQPDIQHHLQSMFYLLRPEETLKMAVKLESAHANRTRYLVVVCRSNEAALLGIDCNEHTTVGLVLRVLADTSIKLDGDGGFSVCVCNQQHIFKPVSVQAMWSALQTLHRASAHARELNHFAGGTSHSWCAYYESHVGSDRSCLNEWHAMDCIESRRPPSPDSLRLKPRMRDETERVIRCTLKEIMMSVDLDEVTSKVIRERLEEELDMDLAEYKPFIDHEMLTILGQMDAPTEIFEHVYLGSEWNASNLEELQRNGVRHILNVTREIDNFFPGMFDYLNIRVYDDERTDLLKHWDNTFKYINKARNEGSKVLVHCKMGISRSASVVIAYAMKAFNWNFDKALKHVKTKRSCIKPNTNFLNQLETYQGILDAMKNKEKLQRSKSETNLKSPKNISRTENKVLDPTPLVLALTGSYTGRPRSWSPETKVASELLPPPQQTSVSLENLAYETRHMLMPCANGSYSVSPNQIIRLKEDGAPSVKHIVNVIENARSGDRKEPSRRSQRLIFGIQNEQPHNKTSDILTGNCALNADAPNKAQQVSPSKSFSHKSFQPNHEVEKIHTWDPGEAALHYNRTTRNRDSIVKSDSGIVNVKTNRVTNSEVIGNVAELSNSECDERQSRQRPDADKPPDLGSICEHVEPRARRRDNERKFNETCAIRSELERMERARDRGASTWGGRMSASAPTECWLRVAPLRRRRATCASQGDLPRAPGLVSSRRQEFEARREAEAAREVPVRGVVEASAKRSRVVEARARSLLRYSTCERPPPAPTVLPPGPAPHPPTPAPTPATAQTRKQLQHGKTHPLTRLNHTRSSSRYPVYNTM